MSSGNEFPPLTERERILRDLAVAPVKVTDAMVERVAQTLAAVDGWCIGSDWNAISAGGLEPSRMREFRRAARAALSAALNPEEAGDGR